MSYFAYLNRLRRATTFRTRRKSRTGARTGENPSGVALLVGRRGRRREKRPGLLALVWPLPGLIILGLPFADMRVPQSMRTLLVMALCLVGAIFAETSDAHPPTRRVASLLYVTAMGMILFGYFL